MGIGRSLTEIAIALLGLSALGLLISRSGDTAKVIGAVSEGYGSLISVATAQNASQGIRR